MREKASGASRTFVGLYPKAEPFEEVEPKLFKSVEDGPCRACGRLTPFLDYSLDGMPVSVCSEECIWELLDTGWKR